MVAVSISGQLRIPRQVRGFTLIELVITLLIAIILVTLALPSFRELMINSHVTDTTNQLIHDLNLARSEASSRGTLVAVVSNSNSNDWSSGWKVIADTAFKADGTFDTVLHASSGVATDNNYSVRTKVNIGAGIGNFSPTDAAVVFNAQGNLIPLAQSFSINVCRPDSKPAQSRVITVAPSGIVTSQTDTTSSPAPSC